MQAVTCGAAVVVAVLGMAGTARADVVPLPDSGFAVATYTQGPSGTLEVETITDMTWQGSWRVGGVAWSGALHGSNSYLEAMWGRSPAWC